MSAVLYSFEHLKVTSPKEFVINVEFDRPANNAMNLKMFSEITECFRRLSSDKDCRVIILSAAGEIFSAGVDIKDMAENVFSVEGDVGRKGFFFMRVVKDMQAAITSLEECPKPVLVAVHNACIGAGVDLITACDMRYCTKDSYVQVKEADIGLAADLGTLQRLPKILGNQSLVRELCYTCRKMYSEEAHQQGLVSRVFPDKEAMMESVLNIAVDIAKKSPIAVQGTKVNLLYARDHSVQNGLDYISTWNSGMLQSDDMANGAAAALTNQSVTFLKL